ncbi:hypothetical protein A35E_00579 [secondary endosymbiont of Heteropsylla cubana]|uniref:Uncharacterized protein n=1 Tax=secondary endosymbiont of Heteropsylla cubana TaxID=134287 RepID=J7GTJ9_9ENTR|nr:hypothetical protein [secondary endosymbiont of Heteropsylla cubana]AFP85864.1 hypothetical protein A35E_00579 [secondary endosymbiont of Heteropsylla cubana]
MEGQIIMKTQEQVICQVNALSILDFSNYPILFDKPLRTSCVIHFRTEEINDIEKKVKLGSNIYSKRIMIMQTPLMSALHLNRPIPFSVLLVFKEFYTVVYGDNTSATEGITFINELTDKPINQEIAATSSVNPLDYIQPISPINEKK